MSSPFQSCTDAMPQDDFRWLKGTAHCESPRKPCHLDPRCDRIISVVISG